MNNKLIQYGIPVLVLLVIFFPLFQANFVYLDDAHLLWHNEREESLNVWFKHGRLISGLTIGNRWASINTIDAVKLSRIYSIIGWLLAICVFVKVATQWARLNLIDNRVVLIGAVYIACSPFVAITIGWGGTCFAFWIAYTAGLLGGHILYTQLIKHKRFLSIPIHIQLLVLLMGLVSLFTYQIGIGMFLIPFLLHYNSRKFEKPDAILITGVISMLVVVGIYFLLYKLQIRVQKLEIAERTELELNVFKKISFFVGVPTAQAFSFNMLFSLRSIFSQAFYILAIVVWAVHAFTTERNKPVVNKIIYLAVVFALLMLIYLPVMVTVENFSSYRTMMALNTAVTLMLINMIVQWIKPVSWKQGFAIAAMLIFVGVGFYNFRSNFLNPIVKEYQLVRAQVEKQYTPGINKVYFLRPPENFYTEQFNVHYYRDEFGVPLTHKDWVPEPLVKQIIYEKTHDKSIADKVQIVMFTPEEAENFNKQVALKEPNAFAVDVQQLFNNK